MDAKLMVQDFDNAKGKSVQTLSEIGRAHLLGCYAVRLLYEPTFRGTYRLHHQVDKNPRVRNVNSNWQPKRAAKNTRATA
jgi:hypothetical protein